MPTTYATAFAAHHARGSTLGPRDPTFRPRDTMVHRPTMLRPHDTTTTTTTRSEPGESVRSRGIMMVDLPISNARRSLCERGWKERRCDRTELDLAANPTIARCNIVNGQCCDLPRR